MDRYINKLFHVCITVPDMKRRSSSIKTCWGSSPSGA